MNARQPNILKYEGMNYFNKKQKGKYNTARLGFLNMQNV